MIAHGIVLDDIGSYQWNIDTTQDGKHVADTEATGFVM